MSIIDTLEGFLATARFVDVCNKEQFEKPAGFAESAFAGAERVIGELKEIASTIKEVKNQLNFFDENGKFADDTCAADQATMLYEILNKLHEKVPG